MSRLIWSRRSCTSRLVIRLGLSDRVIVLDHGQVIADDTPDRVRADDAVIRAYLGDFDVA